MSSYTPRRRAAKTKLKGAAAPLAIVYRPLSDIEPYPNNPKEHSAKQIAALAKSIAVSGFINPIIVDDAGVIIAGHGRCEAAKLAGLERVPAIVVSHLSEAQRKAYRIADNRLADVGACWSTDKLQLEVTSILEIDGDFDLELTGFELRDLELALDKSAVDDEAESDDPIPEVPKRAVSQLGDCWEIGEHRLLCGDALDEASYRALLAKERPAMVFTDSPYNCPMAGHATGNGKSRHREFVMASGEMSDAEFQQFLLTFMLHCARFAKPGALQYMCMDWRQLGRLLNAGSVAFDELINLCVWTKSNAGLGALYRSQHELVAVFKKGKAPHTNNVELGKHGRNRSNVWPYAGMNTFSRERDEALANHPTVKPLALVRDAILDASRRGEIVLDPFGGSGTTLVAAAKTARIARLIELDPLYCDVIVARAQRTLGIAAQLKATGENFSAVAKRRGVAGHG